MKKKTFLFAFNKLYAVKIYDFSDLFVISPKIFNQ